MKSSLANEIERTMENFFKTATNEEFWGTLEEAGWDVYSESEIPVLNYHNKNASFRYSVKPETPIA